MAALDVSTLHDWLRELLPVRGGPAEVSYVEATRRDTKVFVTLQLIMHESAVPHAPITDIKEQEMLLGTEDDVDPPERVRAMLEGWCTVLGEVLTALPRDELDTLMPHDLFPRSVLGLARSHTADDFARALRAKGRMGAFLP
jgi:hypothetical protein